MIHIEKLIGKQFNEQNTIKEFQGVFFNTDYTKLERIKNGTELIVDFFDGYLSIKAKIIEVDKKLKLKFISEFYSSFDTLEVELYSYLYKGYVTPADFFEIIKLTKDTYLEQYVTFGYGKTNLCVIFDNKKYEIKEV